MEVTLLRIMTRKSVISGGKYKGRRVEEILEHYPKHLSLAYFNFSKISYTDDVLNELGITEEYRITKPGKSDEMRHKFFSDQIKKQYSELDSLGQIKLASKRAKKFRKYGSRVLSAQENKFSTLLRKDRLKATNQGAFRK